MLVDDYCRPPRRRKWNTSMELKFIRIFRKYSDYHCSLIFRDLERKFDPMRVEWGNYEGIVIADLSDFIPYFWIPVMIVLNNSTDYRLSKFTITPIQ
jgi:hypothetical protein